MTKKVQSYIKEIKAAILSVAPDAEIILFGSQARGDAQEDSDIDLLVLVEGEEVTMQEQMAITTPLYDLELKTQTVISSIVRTRKQWFNAPFKTPFYINVMNEGIKL